MFRSVAIVVVPLLALLASCSSAPQPMPTETPVGLWAPDKGAMLTAMQAKLIEGHPSLRHLDLEALEDLVDRTSVSWIFEPDHTYRMNFVVDLGIDQRRVRSSGSWDLHDGILQIVERESSTGKVDPDPIVAVFDGQAMHIEKDLMTVVLYRR